MSRAIGRDVACASCRHETREPTAGSDDTVAISDSKTGVSVRGWLLQEVVQPSLQIQPSQIFRFQFQFDQQLGG